MASELSFRGVKKDAPRAKLPKGYFQEDVNGDRTTRPGSWKRRRGMRRLDITKQDGPVTSLLGFELAGEGFGLVVGAGGSLSGFTGVEIVGSEDGDGYGAGAYGGSSYGS